MTDIRPDELCATILGLQPQGGDTVVIAIDGPSGSGKSTLARQLAASLGAQVLRLDDVYRGWRGLAAAPAVVVRDILEPITRGEPGRTPRWDWGASEPGPDIVVSPGGVLMLDGCGSGARIIRPYLSHLIWVEAPADVRRARVVRRGDDTVAEWWDLWAAQEAEHFAAEGTAASADVRID